MDTVLTCLQNCAKSDVYSGLFRERILEEVEKQKKGGKTIDSVFCSCDSIKEDLVHDLEILNLVLADLSDYEE
jgi:hypothetical protein